MCLICSKKTPTTISSKSSRLSTPPSTARSGDLNFLRSKKRQSERLKYFERFLVPLQKKTHKTNWERFWCAKLNVTIRDGMRWDFPGILNPRIETPVFCDFYHKNSKSENYKILGFLISGSVSRPETNFLTPAIKLYADFDTHC